MASYVSSPQYYKMEVKRPDGSTYENKWFALFAPNHIGNRTYTTFTGGVMTRMVSGEGTTEGSVVAYSLDDAKSIMRYEVEGRAHDQGITIQHIKLDQSDIDSIESYAAPSGLTLVISPVSSGFGRGSGMGSLGIWPFPILSRILGRNTSTTDTSGSGDVGTGQTYTPDISVNRPYVPGTTGSQFQVGGPFYYQNTGGIPGPSDVHLERSYGGI